MASIKLPKELIGQLEGHQRTLHDLIDEIKKAESCGIECQELWRVHNEESEKISKLLQHYK